MIIFIKLLFILKGVRLLGIGRNQYISIMNNVKTKGSTNFLWPNKKSSIRSHLPNQQIETEIEHWWIVNIGFVSEDDIEKCSKVEKSMIDLIIDSGSKAAGQLTKSVVQSLSVRGLIYFEVPIDDQDQIIVPPLKDFVMNRVSGDYFENLLYKLFISTDERTTISKLSKILDIDIRLVKQAVSMYIRLGLAKKKNIEPNSLGELSKSESPKWNSSWAIEKESSKEHKSNQAELNQDLENSKIEALDQQNLFRINPGKKRIAFLFDSTLAAYLMMGNLGEEIKKHAVMMFEVGKLADERLDDFIKDLESVTPSSEGEAQIYFDHAINLRNTLKLLRYNKSVISESDGGIDLIRCERLNSLDHAAQLRILSESYALLISMAPISGETLTITSQIPCHFGPVVPQLSSIWFKLFLYRCAENGPNFILYPKGTRVINFPDILKTCETVWIQPWDHEQNIVPIQNCLSILNDLLLNSPVLIHPWTFIQNSTPPKTINLSFPFEETLFDYCSSENEYTEYNLHTHHNLKLLQQRINLKNSCGFVKMLLIDDPLNNIIKWVPFELHFGIPLFSASLNQSICAKIENKKLFSSQNLLDYSNSSREITLRLLDFISESNKQELELELGVPNYPSKIISFTQFKENQTNKKNL